MSMTGARVLAGRYVLLEVLGTGGMATVWRARDEVLGRDVAVKVLSPQHAADPGFLARFDREARHVAALNDPRIVMVFDCGVDGQMPFIVMEFVAGRTLRRILDEAGALPTREAISIAAAVCEALAAAHAAGLVHRDIKPANIMLSGGEVKILDFGIARAAGPAGGPATLAVLGTAAYLSPEQAAGQPAGPQSDLYSVGCVLFEMLTGSPPFTAESPVGVAYRQVHDSPGPLSARRPGMPPQLEWISAQLLAKDPADRPPSAAAARASLMAALGPDQTAVLASPPVAIAAAPPRSRRPSLAEAVLMIALVVALAALALVWLHKTPGTPGHGTSASRPPAATSPASRPRHHAPKSHAAALPPAAAAAAAFVGDLQAGVADGQVTPQAGQDLFNRLQQLLFVPPGSSADQVDQRYAQLVQGYDEQRSHGQITGPAAATLRRALNTLGTAIGAL